MTVNDSSNHIVITTEAGIMQIRMNRPEKKNAITRAMYQTMADALIRADEDASVRVIVIAGTADCFTSGNDLADFRNVPEVDGERPANPFLPAINQTKKPVIAAVAGVAVGIGTTMLLHCDLVYAGTNARFQLPFVNLGLCPELGSSVLLPLLMGHQRAAELLLLGEPFSAATAREVGIVNAVCADGDVIASALEKARQLAAQPLAAVCLTKSLLKRSRERDVASAMEIEIAHFSERLKSPEAAEAFQAFAERRKPDFSRFN